MRLLVFLNRDVHASTALELLFPHLRKHEVKIILSEKVGNIANLPPELLEMRRCEQNFDQEIFSRIARNFGHEVATYSSANSEIALDDFKKFSPDLIVSIRFGQIFKQPLINIPRLGVLNLHSGLLPNYRGVLATFWAILHGEEKIGTTLHYITDASIDTGDIVGFSESKVDHDSSLVSNITNLYHGGCSLLLESLEKIFNGEKIKIVKQSELGEGKYFSYPTADDIKKFLSLNSVKSLF